MASNLIDHLSKPSDTLEAITLAIITHSRRSINGLPKFQHHPYPSAENQQSMSFLLVLIKCRFTILLSVTTHTKAFINWKMMLLKINLLYTELSKTPPAYK